MNQLSFTLSKLIKEPLLLCMRKSRDIYLIRSGMRHLIYNYETFIAMNFTNKQVTHNIPHDVLELFPKGTDISVSHEKI